MKPLPLAIVALATLLGIEAAAWWWMNPASARTDEPILTHRPGSVDRGSKVENNEETSDSLPPHHPEPVRRSLGEGESPIPNLSAVASAQEDIPSRISTITPLPEVYARAAPMLRCSSGQVFLTQYPDSLSLHLAFFRWDDTDTGSVLEAFRHMPEACLGSIGMTLVSRNPPIRHTIGDQTLVFDHTTFRDPGTTGPSVVHSFRAVWVAGFESLDSRHTPSDLDTDHLRSMRLHAALHRLRPAHACVVQGAVRGALHSGQAWEAFKTALLDDLAFIPER